MIQKWSYGSPNHSTQFFLTKVGLLRLKISFDRLAAEKIRFVGCKMGCVYLERRWSWKVLVGKSGRSWKVSV